MIRLATIGTSWITKAFIGGIDLLPECFTLAGIYSRTKEKGESFLKEIEKDVRIYTNLEEMAKSDQIDAVYIASPNSLHFKQAMLMVENKKHIIVEKPAVISEEEFLKLAEASRQNDVIFMEAVIPMHLPQRKLIKEALWKVGRVQSSRFQFCQFSSKYQDYLRGKNPNIFNPKFATGTLMDLGIYCIYPAIDFFGLPDTVSTSASFLENGSDSSISSIYKYTDHIVSIIASKTCQSDLPSEIIGDCGKISIGHISKYDEVTVTVDGKEEHLAGVMSKQEMMSYEAKDFYRYITKRQETAQEYAEMTAISHTVCAMMETMRLQSGIRFFE